MGKIILNMEIYSRNRVRFIALELMGSVLLSMLRSNNSKQSHQFCSDGHYIFIWRHYGRRLTIMNPGHVSCHGVVIMSDDVT